MGKAQRKANHHQLGIAYNQKTEARLQEDNNSQDMAGKLSSILGNRQHL